MIKKIEIDVAKRGHITNTYLVYDKNKEAILIDPADDSNKIISYIIENDLKIRYIIITHAHGDHIGALESLQKHTNAKILVHENDYNSLINKEENYSDMLGVKKQNVDIDSIIKVNDGDNFIVGTMRFKIIHTPGHTSGSICIYYENESENALFTGDTIFCDSYGRCDLYTGNFEKMVESIKKLFDMFDNIDIYPGHNKIVNINISKKYIKLLLVLKGVKI